MNHPTNPSSGFGLLRRFLAHRRSVNHTESFMWLGLFSNADVRTGETYVKVETVAKVLDLDKREAHRAVTSLTKKKFIEVVEKGGGRGKSSVRRVTVPEKETVGPTPTETTIATSPETVGPTPREIETINSGEIAHETVGDLGPKQWGISPETMGSTHTPSAITSANTSTSISKADFAAADSFFDCELKEWLISKNIHSPALEEIMSAPGITIAIAKRLWEVAAKKAKSNTIGLFLKLVREREYLNDSPREARSKKVGEFIEKLTLEPVVLPKDSAQGKADAGTCAPPIPNLKSPEDLKKEREKREAESKADAEFRARFTDQQWEDLKRQCKNQFIPVNSLPESDRVGSVRRAFDQGKLRLTEPATAEAAA
jgi:hypothetical protein